MSSVVFHYSRAHISSIVFKNLSGWKAKNRGEKMHFEMDAAYWWTDLKDGVVSVI